MFIHQKEGNWGIFYAESTGEEVGSTLRKAALILSDLDPDDIQFMGSSGSGTLMVVYYKDVQRLDE